MADAACGNVVFCAEYSAGSVFAQSCDGTRCTTAPRHPPPHKAAEDKSERCVTIGAARLPQLRS